MKHSAVNEFAGISRTINRILFAFVVVGFAGCTNSSDANAMSRRSKAAMTTFQFAGPHGSQSRVQRGATGDGWETLHGETDVVDPVTGREQHIDEHVTLDGRGNLVYAEIVVTDPSENERPIRMKLVAPTGLVEVSSKSNTMTRHVATDAPWTYVSLSKAQSFVTPVSAWVMKRAADSSSLVRIVDPNGEQNFLAPRDQIVVDTENGKTVVLGWDAADVDGDFVREIRREGRGALFRAKSPEA